MQRTRKPVNVEPTNAGHLLWLGCPDLFRVDANVENDGQPVAADAILVTQHVAYS